MTELEKLEAGLEYCYDDPEVEARKENAVLQCKKYNAIDDTDYDAQYAQLKAMLGGVGEKVWIGKNFNCDNTEIRENNGAEELALAGDAIVICTTILPAELEKLVNCEWLCSDGVITLKVSELNIYSCVPPIPENFHCLEIVWD